MPSLSLKIILEDGAVTRVMKFPSGATVADATQLVQEKLHSGGAGKDYGLFLTSADDDLSGIWLEDPRLLDYYLLKDGDSLHYRCRVRTLRIRMLDGSVKTMHVDESKPVEHLMMTVCGKLGITNHEEYGFCREDEPEEAQAQPAAGTLTLKRQPRRERDAAMQQLSKKLKTDDNVEWLEQKKTLRESSVAPAETLLLKRRLFYSDRKVDARDPVQLNLLFVQARDAVLEGRHPVTEAQAMEFAGIQCQVQYGDYQEDKHKPGFIENLSEFLPQQYSNSWGAEKKVLKEHSKHIGLSQIEAKYLYTKTVRDLSTYGVTFFLVKEIQQKGKKKLVPRLLGISASCVLRMDETTKEVIQAWPLTQVKSYKASRGEMFTLNFGDYSEKEYCVKTNDAYRIRDILQGYIDLIRKKMEGPYNSQASDGGVIYSANVESSKGNFMEVVSHSANKVVETSFVGPTKIVSYAQGSNAKVHGTQIMTAQEVIVTSQSHNKQTAMTGGVAMRTEMSTDTVRKLNDLNGNAVKIVKLLTDPNETSIDEARKIVEDIQRDMPIVTEGVKQCIEKQPDEPAKKKLTMELKELCDSVEQMKNFKNPSEAQETAMKIADLTTQMYFALDPKQKRRSDFIRRSRKSFIDDEHTQATLQRASFINTVAVASQAIDDARGILSEKYEGQTLTSSKVEALKRSGRDKLAKLNAAIALFASAHSDPKNIDYTAAVNSMNTIKEFMPELAKDAQALSSVQDGQDRGGLLRDTRDLCDAVASICRNTGCDDLQKMHDEADSYAKKAGRLIFTFGRGVHPDKENEINDLVKAADDRASLLLATASKLSSEVDDPGAVAVCQAVAKSGHAARGLRVCAQLTASLLHEPHCRSALSAASGDLSSSAQNLTNACRPLLDHPKGRNHADAVRHHSAELAKALERLNNAFGDLDGTEDGAPSAAERERWRLQFVTTLSRAQDTLDGCDKIFDDDALSSHMSSWPSDTLPARLAELNVAVASLVAATRDSENPDYAAADAAMAIIQHHMPGVVKDCKSRSCVLLPEEREEFLGDVKALCEAIRALALNTRHEETTDDSVAEFARASGKLTYMLDWRACSDKEHQIIQLAKSACERSSELLVHAHGLAAAARGGAASELDARGARLADAAQALLATAQLTASTIHAAPCKRALIQCAKVLISDLHRLAEIWLAACQPHFVEQGQQLDDHRKLTEAEIQKLLVALDELPDNYVESTEDLHKKKKRVQFTFSLSQVQNAAKKAETEIDKPLSSKPLTPAQTKEVKRSLADKLASLNAAIAALMVATQDPYSTNYEQAETATATIQKLVPELVEETKALSSGKNDAEQRALLDDMRALCAATEAISACASEGNPLELNDAMSRYANAAQRLTFVCTPTQAQDKHQQVYDKTRALCDKSSELMAAACRLGAGRQGAGGRGGGDVARRARALHTTAQLTASSLHAPQCRSDLYQAALELSQAAARLDQACSPTSGPQAARVKGLRRAFDDAVAELMRTIQELEDDTPPSLSPEQEKRKLEFITTRSAAQAALVDTARELAKPVTSTPLTPPQMDTLQLSLSDRLATLNAAIAALLAATKDPEKPDYAAAQSATATVQELMPDIVKDAKILNIGKKDKAAQSSLLENLRALCEATNSMIGATLPSDDVHNDTVQDLNDAVVKFTDVSGRLVYAFNPRADSTKEYQIIDLTKSTCQKTSELLAQVNDLAEQVGGEQAEDLDTRGAKVADAAQGLLTTAEITAPSLTSPLCQSSLLTSTDALSSSVERLSLTWQPVTSQRWSQKLELAKKQLDEEIAKLRAAVKSGGAKSPTAEARHSSSAALATEQFLDAMRTAASADASYRQVKVRSPTSIARSEEKKLAKSQFNKSVEDARQSICTAEKNLMMYLKADSKPSASLDGAQVCALNKQMEHKLARANAAAAHLLACRGGDNPDYQLASKCVSTLSDLLPTIVADAKTLGDLKDGKGRTAFLEDTMGLCTASKNLCDTAKSDKKKLTESALSFGNRSSKLLYAISTDIDPSQENEVLLRVKAVGDVACRVTAGSADLHSAQRCASQATVFMYTAKLIAPSIQDPECRDSLITASKDLSAQLKTIITNKPELAAELAALEQLLEALRSDVASGKFVKTREKLVVEDTPLRKLTAQIIEDAKQNAEDTSRLPEDRRAMADFANKLTDELKMMDLANARCKNAPQDASARAELEQAALSLQLAVLLARPRQGAARHGTIVDLADYLKDVSIAAERLVAAADSPARAAGAVAAQARALCACVGRATAPAPGALPIDADHATKECTSRVQQINTAIECCPEGPEKNVLKKEARALNESCSLLNFANQSALATAQGAVLDEALDDLSKLERRLDRMLRPGEGGRHVRTQCPWEGAVRVRVGTAAAGARGGAWGGARGLAPAFVRYVADLRAHVDVTDDKRRLRLAEHLKKLNARLKLLTMETGRQVVTWKDNQSELATITDDILKELDNAEAVIGAEADKTKSLIADEVLKKLLLPVHTYRVEGDEKQLEAKLESSATKLNSMIETVMLSVGKPDSLARSAHVTAESAVQLAAIARAIKCDEDPTKHSKVEEASQELCFVTYNLLKTAESTSQDPNSCKSRRRLLDACRSLTEAINKLTRTASSADKLQRECNELSRSLQTRQSSLQARPSCSLPYAECVSALQTQHAAIENLKSDKPMSRDQFCTSLDLIASAVANNVEYAEQCAYLLSISEHHPELAKEGMFDAARVQKLIAAAQDGCFRVTSPGIVHQAKEESSLLSKQLSDLKQAIQECSVKVTDSGVRRQLIEASGGVEAAGVKLQALLNMEGVSEDTLTPQAFTVLEALSSLQAVAEQPALAPLAASSPPAKQRSSEVLHQTKELLTRATALMRAVKTTEKQQAMTWVMFNTYTKGVVESSDQLVTCVRINGQNAGLLEGAIEIEEDAEMTAKSYVQTQVLIANKWLHKPTFKPQIKTDGEAAARNVIEIGKKMTKHLKDAELDEMRYLSEECEQLLARCNSKYDLETGSALMDRLKDLAKAIDRGVVTIVVEDFIEDEEPLADLETFIDAEKDETKRKNILERKIAELLAHLGRVTRAARAVADGLGGARELTDCTKQASLLAPTLVKAAEQRVSHATEKAVVEEYRTQLAQYSDSLARVRDLCDRAVDPMQFVQTAEETMQRMKEESTSHQNDMQKCSNTSAAIRKLANRVIHVSMSSKNAKSDPELMRALSVAQQRLKDAEPAKQLRPSKMPDWRHNIAEILRATGEVESVLGGEMIFKKLPEPDRPIYNAARNLHAAVREWSARDNEIVAVAKRMAVLMAKLSDHMHSDRKREVISTSKAIVAASHEVAQLARKLALECTDMRIRTNLLQVCDQIPLISGQLKMLTTVKGSSLGHQGTEEDIEAMNMLVGNAQNLMTSIQDVVNAAAGASVKIRSQRGGPRMRWVRKNYQ